MWITEVGDREPGKKPAFDIVGGMCLYVINSEVAAYAPQYVLQTIYGCLFTHTARFAFSLRKTILKNGNANVALLAS